MRLELERPIPVRDDVVPARRPRFRLQNMRLELERPLGYHLVEPQRHPLRDIAEAGFANEGHMAREVDMHIVGHPNMFVTVCVELGWLDYTQLNGELFPSSDLRGLLQLLCWTDLSQISCLASSGAYGALRRLSASINADMLTTGSAECTMAESAEVIAIVLSTPPASAHLLHTSVPREHRCSAVCTAARGRESLQAVHAMVMLG